MSTTTPTEAHDAEIVRWYTRARRFPQLIGKTATGGMIWGGPYTYVQVGVGVGCFIVGTQTVWLWGHFGLIGNAILLLAVSYGLVIIVGRLPIGMRNPLLIGAGALRALSAPAQGTLRGRPLRLRPPHRVRSRLVVDHGARPLADDQLVRPEPAGSAPAAAHEAPEEVVAAPSRRQRLRPTPASVQAATPASSASTRTPTPTLTGVQRLLASTGASTQED